MKLNTIFFSDYVSTLATCDRKGGSALKNWARVVNSNQCKFLKSNGYKSPIGNNDNGDAKNEARPSKKKYIFYYNCIL